MGIIFLNGGLNTTVQDLVHLSQQLEIAMMYLNQDINQTRLELVSAKKNIKNIIDDNLSLGFACILRVKG